MARSIGSAVNDALKQKTPARAGVFALLLCAASAASATEVDTGACIDCHTTSGGGAAPGIPTLGGQPELFILYQLVFFRGGQRKNEVMTPLVADATDAELSAYAAALSALPPPAPPDDRDEVLFARGQALADKHRCGTCHLSGYQGARHVPRLAGQNEAYLAAAMRAFRAGDRIGIQAAMAEVLNDFSEADIAAAAHFLSRASTP